MLYSWGTPSDTSCSEEVKDGRGRRQVKGEEVRSPIKNTPITPAVTHLTWIRRALHRHIRACTQTHTHTRTLRQSYKTADDATWFPQLSLPFAHKPTALNPDKQKIQWILTPWSITEVYLSQPPDKPRTQRQSPSATPRLLSPCSRCEYGYYRLVILKQLRPNPPPSARDPSCSHDPVQQRIRPLL